jgi:hypothetical protein
MPTSRRRPPLPKRTVSEPVLGLKSVSLSMIASLTRSPARQSTTITPRRRAAVDPWPASRITATISSTVGGSAG